MKIRPISDAHLEFVYEASETAPIHQRTNHIDKILPSMEDDSQTILVVAGDLASAVKIPRIVNFFHLVADRFKHIIYVLGNHEHYHGNIHTTENVISDALKDFPNITVVGNKVKTLLMDDVLFVAATLWTDYGKKTFAVDDIRNSISCGINDHHLIKITQSDGMNRSFHPDDGALLHEDAVIDIDRALESHKGKSIVITHHLPSFKCVSARFTLTESSRKMNHAFASDLDWLIERHQPDAWIFGHTHDPFCYKINNTTLVCNPVGYPNENNVFRSKYNPNLVIEL